MTKKKNNNNKERKVLSSVVLHSVYSSRLKRRVKKNTRVLMNNTKKPWSRGGSKSTEHRGHGQKKKKKIEKSLTHAYKSRSVVPRPAMFRNNNNYFYLTLSQATWGVARLCWTSSLSRIVIIQAHRSK